MGSDQAPHEGAPPAVGSVPLQRVPRAPSPRSAPGEHTERLSVSRKGLSPGAAPLHRTLDFQPLDLGEISVCCLQAHPLCSVQQPERRLPSRL